jgi:hypothetical protein
VLRPRPQHDLELPERLFLDPEVLDEVDAAADDAERFAGDEDGGRRRPEVAAHFDVVGFAGRALGAGDTVLGGGRRGGEPAAEDTDTYCHCTHSHEVFSPRISYDRRACRRGIRRFIGVTRV